MQEYDPLPCAKLWRRAEEWFYLGISIGPLLKLPSGQGFVNALKELWDEYEASFGQKSVAEMGVVCRAVPEH
jgi:hypothetical protein